MAQRRGGALWWSSLCNLLRKFQIYWLICEVDGGSFNECDVEHEGDVYFDGLKWKLARSSFEINITTNLKNALSMLVFMQCCYFLIKC